MVRVVDVKDERTITVQRGSVRADVTLAGVMPLDRMRGTEFLRWTLGNSWLSLEPAAGEKGAYFAWRSPDGLFVNREYVLRGYAEATLPEVVPTPQTPAVYLGVVDPGKRKLAEAANPARERPQSRPAPPTTPRPRSRRGGR
jgi:hypothetical protein